MSRRMPLILSTLAVLPACHIAERLLLGTAFAATVPPIVPLVAFLAGLTLASWAAPDYLRSGVRQAAERAKREAADGGLPFSTAHMEEPDGQEDRPREPRQPDSPGPAT